MKNLILLPILFLITLASCSDANTEVTTVNNYKVIVFPDGSKAYLNKNSTIGYNKTFEQRVVTQNGEVFYSVIKGNAPFIVKTKTGEIKVLGTEFNVKSSKILLEVEVEKGTIELKVNKLVKKIHKGQKAFSKGLNNDIKTSKAQFKHRKWIKSLNKELKILTKNIEKGSKDISKETKKAGHKLKKKLKKLK